MNDFRQNVIETKALARSVAEYLNKHVELAEDIRIHFVGCPNACGQKQIADIGLQGVLVKTSEGMQEAFELAVGGILGPNAQFNEKLKGRIVAQDLESALEKLILYYKENRLEKESFNVYYKRVGIQSFQEKLNQIIEDLAVKPVVS